MPQRYRPDGVPENIPQPVNAFRFHISDRNSARSEDTILIASACDSKSTGGLSELEYRLSLVYSFIAVCEGVGDCTPTRLAIIVDGRCCRFGGNRRQTRNQQER